MPNADAYLLYHSIGQYPGKAADMSDGLAAFTESWCAADDGQWGYALGQRQRFIDLWRGIINAPEGTLTTCESVTSGLYSLIGALPAKYLEGRKLLIAGDCFPSLHFLLTRLAGRFGFTLETVPLRPGATWVEEKDVIRAWTPEVGVALLTWVSSTSSARCDIPRLVAHGRKMGSLIGVDITQGAGLLPYDVTEPEIDFALSTSLKWMCGTPGAGVLYAAPALIPECRPELRGWFSQDDIFSWDLDAFDYAPDIRRFDSGTPGTVAALASLPALEWHARQDRAEMVAHNRALTAALMDGLDDLGLPLATPRPEERRGGSVMVTLPERHPGAAVVAGLRAAGVSMDARGQTLRMSPGCVTTAEGVSRAMAELGRILHR